MNVSWLIGIVLVQSSETCPARNLATVPGVCPANKRLTRSRRDEQIGVGNGESAIIIIAIHLMMEKLQLLDLIAKMQADFLCARKNKALGNESFLF